MNKTSIIAALRYGCTVCFGTSRYEVSERAGAIVATNVYDSTSTELNAAEMQRCFIKTGGV